MNIVMESDIGTFKPVGLSFTGSTEAKAIIIEMMKYMKPYNASRVTDGAVGLDISWWFVSGVPAGGLIDNEDKYFYFHHSNGELPDLSHNYNTNCANTALSLKLLSKSHSALCKFQQPSRPCKYQWLCK